MSTQLESRHFFRLGDLVRHRQGHFGRVIEERTLYAVIRWDYGTEDEVDQFDPEIEVEERAGEA